MQRRKFITLIGGAVAGSSAAAAGGATRIAVLDAEFRPVKLLSGPDLAAFAEHWAKRSRAADSPMQPDYKIDIQYPGRSERWLYDAAGLVRVLSKRKTPVYRLEEPVAFNELLGIGRQRAPR